MVNVFIVKNVSLFIQITVRILVTIHATLACTKNVLISSEKRTCSECFKFCRSIKCFDHHKKSHRSKGVDLPSKCDTFRCQLCLAVVDRKRQDKHICGEHVCHICKEYVLSDHLCHMQPEPPKRPCDKFIFYDFSTGEHVVNFAIAQYADGTEFVFKGYDALNEFCLFLFSMEHKGFSAIAHNAKGFDAVLIQRWLIENRPTADMRVIHSGQKIMQLFLTDYKIRLIDSLNWFQMPLSNFPKTFGLDLSLYSKGDFPFKFNTFANWNYVGLLFLILNIFVPTRDLKNHEASSLYGIMI